MCGAFEGRRVVGSKFTGRRFYSTQNYRTQSFRGADLQERKFTGRKVGGSKIYRAHIGTGGTLLYVADFSYALVDIKYQGKLADARTERTIWVERKEGEGEEGRESFDGKSAQEKIRELEKEKKEAEKEGRKADGVFIQYAIRHIRGFFSPPI